MTASDIGNNEMVIKLKHDLERFQAPIVTAYGVLTWEKKYYPVVVLGGISVAYFVLWYMDLSVITLMSLLALLTTISHYFLLWCLDPPDFILDFFSTKMAGLFWNIDNDAKFESVCGQMYIIKESLAAWYQYLFKERKSTGLVIVKSLVLLAMAWIGSIVNNLLLMYLVTLLIAMWAGLQAKHVFKKLQ
ncbi:GL19800 [Drosophila persimilis]|uniref:GL19800 n=2 Tax=Drosophila persimilis TaxID=7234 RepID=B4GYH1_DROPE|nr:ARL-6-interacting protein 1 homolog [Drosophila persimilis]XP_026846306.1 ARL-6-interacting protein 1 homolog [Drosophila persimilis]EDW27827.1 GL19921 [Drosophila persimilis]EDW27835.1 GL19800 [Drosophila persimilis]